tara:strand:+ start:1307 stop:2077 length:771 start_codon:yes stop_codon:yes gene_type:complete
MANPINTITFLNGATDKDGLKLLDAISEQTSAAAFSTVPMNTEMDTYDMQRDKGKVSDFSLDDSVDAVREKNHDLAIESGRNNGQFMKSISNRMKQLNNQAHHISFIEEVIEGDNGEQAIIEDKIQSIEEQNEIIKRKQIIYDYYEKKRKYQINVFKNMTYILLALLIVTGLSNMGMIPENALMGLIGFGLGCMVLYLGYVTMDMVFRDHTDFDQYNFAHSSQYLNRGGELKKTDLPPHMQKDVVSEECETSVTNS